MKTDISVIIPVFNCDKYLDDCIISVLMQSHQNYEVICVDDNSTDNSLSILKKYAKYDARIKILTNNKNKGPGYCRNKGLDIAGGKYIFFLDGDDWIDNKTFEVLYDYCEKCELDFVMFKYIAYYEDKNDFCHEYYYDMNYMDKYSGEVFNHWDLDPQEVFRLPIGPCNKLYNKSFLDENNIRFPNENIVQEDNLFFFKIITLSKKISFLNVYLYNRRRWSNSIMATLNDSRLFDRIYVAETLLKYFLSDTILYSHYKINLHHTISEFILDYAYNCIDNGFKEEMYLAIHNLYIKFFDNYDIKEDIMMYVDKEFLIKFNLIDM